MSEDKFLEMIHNWDHDIHTTSISDMEKNLAHILAVIGNLSDVRVLLTKDELVIQHVVRATFGCGESFGRECEPHWTTGLHVVNLDSLPREVTGRTRHYMPIGMYTLTQVVGEAA